MCPSVSFFFSSRRRHTRWPRDWSSDVCSSDLAPECRIPWREIVSKPVSILFYSVFLSLNFTVTRAYATQVGPGKIGRASCRERVWRSVVAVGVKRKEQVDRVPVRQMYERGAET